jgi:hypothetical protein
MADPLQVLSSLETLADHYAVFEPDQVLTHGQLNSVSDFWGDQVRLSRVALAAVGLVSGLHVSRGGGGVRVTRGLGVSTDGDLMMLGADTLYDRVRPYDTRAPIYRPFYRGTATDGTPTDMMTLHELVPAGESDVLAHPLTDLGTGLDDMAVLMLMETVVNDPDLCSGTDCDNLGRDALQRTRLLLIGRRDAQDLLDRAPLRPASERAQGIVALAMRRPELDERVLSDQRMLTSVYESSARMSLGELRQALPTLAASCPEVLSDMFGGDPTPRWISSLTELMAQGRDIDVSAQVLFGFAKDLIDQWNELREALLADDSVLLPSVAAFPKHLLLGALAAPREQRSGLYPSPLDATTRQQAAHARFLAWKLDAMIASYRVPTDTELRVTPSVADDRPLEERAIPWYYRQDATTPIHVAWNFRLSARRQEGHNRGYRSTSWSTLDHVRNPLRYTLGAHDFFRIEGHLGRDVETVQQELRRQIEVSNLPFQLQAVLLHDLRPDRRIRVRPNFRYTPLHTLHYLFRQDVSLRLDEGVQFSHFHLDAVTEAVQQQVVLGTTNDGNAVIGAARTASQAVTGASQAATPLMSPPTYSAYLTLANGDAGAQWKASYANSLQSVGDARMTIGPLSRIDYLSPFDSLLHINQPHWIEWLDTLIADLDRQADDKLMLRRFVQAHPQLDHAGGVWRGGTFVLVYDDGGRVVADFALPYPAEEVDEPEPQYPPLTRPPFRPPRVVGNGIRLVKPIDVQIKDRFAIERNVFQHDLDLHTANIEGLVKGAFVPSNVVLPPKDIKVTGNPYLDLKASELANQRGIVQELQGMLTDPQLGDDVRVQVQRDLDRTQLQMADTLGVVAEQMVTSGVDVAGPAGSQLRQEMTTAVGSLQSGAAKTQLDSRLTEVQNRATGGQAVLLGNLRRLGGF